LALARANAEPAVLAPTLNRLGNWLLNQGQAQSALEHHQEALDLFARLQDQSGLADTYDLLGMASYLNGDIQAGSAYLERAVSLYQALDHRQGLVASLGSLAMRGPNCLTDTVVPAVPGSLSEPEGQAALALARAIQNRPAEAFALIVLGSAACAAGEDQRGEADIQAGLALARSLEHTQWQTLGHCALGTLYLNRGDHARALDHLQRAHTLAQATRSVYWMDTTGGWLARAHLSSGTDQGRAAAAQVLAAVFRDQESPQALGQRLVWAALAELALATGDPALALQRVDALLATSITPDVRGGAAIPYLGRLRALALWQLGQPQVARKLLEAARVEAEHLGFATERRRLEAALERLAAPNG
jgi:tetratricopeptide (TPR) repeat protein